MERRHGAILRRRRAVHSLKPGEAAAAATGNGRRSARTERTALVGLAAEDHLAGSWARDSRRSAADLARHRTHQIRRDDDHQLGLRAAEAARTEQRAEDRKVAEERRLVDVVGVGVDQAGDHEALARAQLDRGFGTARGQRRNVEAAEADRAFGRQFADFRADAHQMRPSASTIGVKARLTPYCLYSIVTAPRAWRPGSGIRRRRGSWRFRPTSAVRFGSASVVTRPSVAARSSVPSRSRPKNLPAAPGWCCRRRS